MTEPTRGARPRRGGRRPGWFLMTVLLVLAIVASSALVFTDRVELLKLAVILALWAAVVAAFVSVIYRRQSDSDQAKVRDLKLVYDLQLDREISARREYELAVESQLRRELAAELQAQQADEVASLRAELAALRANLEYLFDADLSHRHAIEADRSRAAGPWTPHPESAGRVSSSRIDAEDVEVEDVDAHPEGESHTEESPIIDVPAEPHPPEGPPESEDGAHRRAAQEAASRHRAEDAARQHWAPPPPPGPPRRPAPDRTAEPAPQFPWLPPRPPERPAASGARWQPAPAQGQWVPAGESGSQWVAGPPDSGVPDEYVGRRRAPESQPRPSQQPGPAAEATPPPSRHSTPGDMAPGADEDSEPDTADGAHTGGQSVADLLARLQVTPSGGGRRRRRED